MARRDDRERLVPMTTLVSAKQKQALADRARVERRTASQLVRFALESYLGTAAR
jgi:hypothetical protein